MSRAKTVCLTFMDFVNGPFHFRIPQGYKRIQINHFAISFEPENFIIVDRDPKEINTAGISFHFTQSNQSRLSTPTAVPDNQVPKFVALVCQGLGAWRDTIAILTPSAPTISHGMNGNVYEIAEQDLIFTPVSNANQFINNFHLVFQFTLL